MQIGNIFAKSKLLVKDNSPVILTAIGVAGVVTTAYLTHRAALQADKIIREESGDNPDNYSDGFAGFREKAQLTWKLYIPPVSVAAVTCISIIGANRIGTRRAAAVAAAYTISERAYDEYKAKVVEKLGETKEKAVRDEIAQDRVNKTAANREVIITTNGGSVLCLDAWSGRYFESDMETIRKAQNDINAQIIHADYARVDDYYDIIGLEHTTASPEFGWNTNKMMELDFSTTLVDEKTPCLVVSFASMPISEPWRFC